MINMNYEFEIIIMATTVKFFYRLPF